MSNQELCTQYQLIVSMLEDGKTDKVIEILKSAINRIDRSAAANPDKQSE